MFYYCVCVYVRVCMRAFTRVHVDKQACVYVSGKFFRKVRVPLARAGNALNVQLNIHTQTGAPLVSETCAKDHGYYIHHVSSETTYSVT